MSNTRDDRPTIFPCLVYRDVRAAIAWLNKAFGFETHLIVDAPDGSTAHVELKHGAGYIMLGQADAARGYLSPQDLPALTQGLYVAVDDLDAHHQRARAAGATITREPHDTDYGSRDYAATDPEGHHWHFGTYRPGPA